MKFILKNKSMLLMILAVSFCLAANAQQYKTDVSVRDQIKNNSVPGVKYADPAAVKAQPKIVPVTGQSLASTTPVKTDNTAKPTALPVTIDLEQGKTAAEKETKKPAEQKVVLPPMQEEKIKEQPQKKE